MTWNRPKLGDRRTRTKFALLPICVGTQCVWLETVTVHEEYKSLNRLFGYEDVWVKVAIELKGE